MTRRRRRSLFWITLIMTLLVGMTVSTVPFTFIVLSNPTSSGTVLAAPIIRNEGLTPGSDFSIEITVANVTKMWSHEFKLIFDPSVLTATLTYDSDWNGIPDSAFTPYPPFQMQLGAPVTNNTGGYIQVAYATYFGDDTGFSTVDPVPIGKITFEVDADGESVFDLQHTKLTGVGVPIIPHDVVDGYFSNQLERHDVAVAGVTANQSRVTPGRPISVKVNVTNEGNTLETFDITVYNDTTPIEPTPTKTVTNLVPMTYKTVEFVWDTTGVAAGQYTLVAEASVVAGESDVDDNTFTFVPAPDLAITNVTVTVTADVVVINETMFFVVVDKIVEIRVTVANEGNVDETFDASVYYSNATHKILIETQTNIYLSTGEKTVLYPQWNTTGVYLGTYTIEAEIPPDPEETDTADNTNSDVQVIVAAGLRDVSVRYILTDLPYPYEIVLGRNVTITVGVKNRGTQSENFTVTVYLNKTVTGTKITLDPKNVTDLEAGNTTALDFTWNTTGVDLGTYAIIANASVVPDEIDETNNVLTWENEVEVVPERHDIAITSVTSSSTRVVVGDLVSIDVTVKNEGNMPETFSVNVYYSNATHKTLIDTQLGVFLDAGDSTTLPPFTWNTTGLAAGTYNVTAEVPPVPDETDIADNTDSVQVDLVIHNIAITSVTPSKATASKGEPISINVKVKNTGNFYENVSVSVSYDGTVIGTKNETDLPPGGSIQLSFPWDTTDVALGIYTISASASVESDEAFTDDNNLTARDRVTITKRSSTISISATQDTFTIGGSTTLNGSINPTVGVVQVTIWYRTQGEETWNNLTAVTTNENSQYSHDWKPTNTGTFEIKANWTGNSNTAGANSDILTINVQEPEGSTMLYVAGAAIAVGVAITLVYFLKIRKPKPE